MVDVIPPDRVRRNEDEHGKQAPDDDISKQDAFRLVNELLLFGVLQASNQRRHHTGLIECARAPHHVINQHLKSNRRNQYVVQLTNATVQHLFHLDMNHDENLDMFLLVVSVSSLAMMNLASSVFCVCYSKLKFFVCPS